MNKNKEIQKYPYNAKITEREKNKIFLSDKISEQIVNIKYTSGHITFIIKDKITHKKKEIVVSIAILFGQLVGIFKESASMKLPSIVPSTEINQMYRAHFPSHAPAIPECVDKIRLTIKQFDSINQQLSSGLITMEEAILQVRVRKIYTFLGRTVRLGNNDLIIHRPKNSQFLEAEQQQIYEQLCQIEQQKKLYNQLVTEEPLAGSKSAISEDNLDGLLQLKGGNLSLLTKILFRIVLIWTIDNSSTTTKGFMPGQINPGFGHPGTIGPAS